VFRRNHTKELKDSRGKLLRAELGESVDHAMRAAGHAVGQVKESVVPLTEAAQAKVTKNLDKVTKRKDKTVARKRRRRVAGLLAAGAAVGAAAAYLVKRRKQQPWEEYEEQAAAEAGSVKDLPEPEQPMTSEPAKPSQT
jgi:hypothetical protein